MTQIRKAAIGLFVLALIVVLPIAVSCTSAEELIPLTSLPDSPKLETEVALNQADYFVKIDGRRWNDGALESFRLSGFIVRYNDQLYVITAGHVQKPDMKVVGLEVYLNRNRLISYSAEIVAINNDIDVAVLRIKGEKFKFEGRVAVFGDSD